MKRALTCLLLAALLCGLLGGCAEKQEAAPAAPEAAPAEAPAAEEDFETAAAKEDFESAVEAQTFAVAMTCYCSGYESEAVGRDQGFLWEATGWYAAWICRVKDCDLISEKQAEDFQKSLGFEGDFAMPAEWAAYGAVRRLKGADGSVYYDFIDHKYRFNEQLGVTLEAGLVTLEELSMLMPNGEGVEFARGDAGQEPNTACVVLTRHFSEGESVAYPYRIRFAPDPDPDSGFAYRVIGVETPPAGARTDPALTFTWEELLKANSLQNIFSLYSSVHITDAEGSFASWLFKRGEDLVILSGDEVVYGQYRNCRFNYEKGSDGKLRAVVGEIVDPAELRQMQEGFLQEYLRGIVKMDLDRIEGDLIWADCIYAGDFRQQIAVDLGTLALREIRFRLYDGSESRTLFRYDEKAPEASYLDSWDEPLRRVHLVWEDYVDGAPVVREETVELPADWEYYPWVSRWGDYTAYMNAGWTRSYRYPGDGVDYTLYLTTAKG